MKYVYVLENELKFRKEIFEALSKINPQLQIRFFSDLQSFADWINLLSTEGNRALEKGGVPFVDPVEPVVFHEDDHLSLLVCSNEILGSKNMALLMKTHQLFVKKGLCKPEELTSIVVTCFDDPDFDLKKLEESVISNVIFKPFDLMILQQHLNNALVGRKPPEESNLHLMKINASIEMIKNIQMEAVSTLGFVTSSDRQIEIGTISKYYSKEFLSGKTRSVMAKCVRCVPHPQLKGQFQVTLSFLALEVGQIRDIRKTITDMKMETMVLHNWNNKPAKDVKSLSAVVLDEKKQTIGDSVQRNIQGIKVSEYNSWDSFISDFDPSKNSLILQKSLPQDAIYKVKLDRSASFILAVEPEMKNEEKIFGLNFEQFKKVDFPMCIAQESKFEWQNIMRMSEPMNSSMQRIIGLNIHQEKHFVKLLQKEKIKNPDGSETVILSFSELNAQEKLNYLKSQSKWPKSVDVVIMTREFSLKLNAEKVKVEGSHILLSDRILSDAEEREMGKTVADIFVTPYDRNYIAARVKAELGLLKNEDVVTHKSSSATHVANPVDVVEISEGGVVLKYSRAIAIGNFRKFILWMPSETDLLEYTATCNYTENVEGEDPHVLNHFIFFGMRDAFLKNIRLWIRENYITSKEKTG